MALAIICIWWLASMDELIQWCYLLRTLRYTVYQLYKKRFHLFGRIKPNELYEIRLIEKHYWKNTQFLFL